MRSYESLSTTPVKYYTHPRHPTGCHTHRFMPDTCGSALEYGSSVGRQRVGRKDRHRVLTKPFQFPRQTTYPTQSHSPLVLPWARERTENAHQWGKYSTAPYGPHPFPDFSPQRTWLLPEPCLLRGPGALGGAMGPGPVEFVPGRSATILPKQEKILNRRKQYCPRCSPGQAKAKPTLPTKSFCTLGPGIEIPLKLHLPMRFHGVHNHFESAVQLEIDLMGQRGRKAAHEPTWQLRGSQRCRGPPGSMKPTLHTSFLDSKRAVLLSLSRAQEANRKMCS